MRFCVRCGREFPREQLIRGYCIDCFKKYIGVFEHKPVLKLTICPKCYSWLFRGDWRVPTSLEDMIKAIGALEISKYIRSELQLIDLEVLDITQKKLDFNTHLKIYLKAETTTFNVIEEVQGSVEYRTCPRCIARSSGTYTHLIQIRFTKKNPPPHFIEGVEKYLQKLISPNDLVNVKYCEGGIDIELDDAAIAKRIVQALSHEFSAKIITSFKAVRFDHRRGAWRGIVTYSLRIPVLERGDLIIYRGSLCIIKDLRGNRLVLLNLSNNVYEEVHMTAYWNGDLKYPSRIEVERYIVKNVEGDKIIIISETSKNELVIKRKHDLLRIKPGNSVLLIKADNIEYIVPGDLELLR